MSMKMMNAAYLVDNVALLSLQEKQEGVEFHCFDMDRKVQIAEGHIGWDQGDSPAGRSYRCAGSPGDAGADARRQKGSLADEKG